MEELFIKISIIATMIGLIGGLIGVSRMFYCKSDIDKKDAVNASEVARVDRKCTDLYQKLENKVDKSDFNDMKFEIREIKADIKSQGEDTKKIAQNVAAIMAIVEERRRL